MFSSQDGLLIDENALFPSPPLDDENEQSVTLEDGSSGVSNISDEYAARKENFRNQVTDSSSQSSVMSREILLRKENMFRNMSTDSSSQDSYLSKIKGYASQTTCSSSQETADTDPVYDNDHGFVDASMRTCQTVSDDLSMCDEEKFRLLDTESSEGTHSSAANNHFNFRRRESTSSSSSGGNSNALSGRKQAKENSDKSDSFSVRSQEFMKFTALNEGNVEESKTFKLSLLERKRSLVDDWDGVNPKEPKLVKYNSIGPIQDFSKMYLRRTSSEGVQIHSEG